MRISIWQQFSSNNSSHFTIIGIFESSEKAQEASEKLKGVFSQIDTWYKEHPQEAEEISESGGEDVSEIERQLGAQYNINWDRAMLWSWNYQMRMLDQLVVVSQEFGADSGAHPIDQLMQRLGGTVGINGDVIWYEQVARTKITISCDASSEADAQEILKIEPGRYDAIPNSTQVRLHIEPFEVDYSPLLSPQPELFEFINSLKSRGCQNFDFQLTEERKQGDYFEDED